MTKRILLVGAVVSALSLYGGLALAEEQERVQEQVQKQEQVQEQIYGSQLMNEQERAEYHAKMREAEICGRAGTNSPGTP